jgi:hypothetical protein
VLLLFFKEECFLPQEVAMVLFLPLPNRLNGFLNFSFLRFSSFLVLLEAMELFQDLRLPKTSLFVLPESFLFFSKLIFCWNVDQNIAPKLKITIKTIQVENNIGNHSVFLSCGHAYACKRKIKLSLIISSNYRANAGSCEQSLLLLSP